MGWGCIELDNAAATAAGVVRLRRLAGRQAILLWLPELALASSTTADAVAISELRPLLDASRALWVTTPLGFSRTPELDLGWPMPLLPGPAVVSSVTARVAAIQGALGRRLLLENIAHHFPTVADGSEVAMLNAICEATGAGIALDLGALVRNAQNHGFDPERWLQTLAVERVVQLRLGEWRDTGASRGDPPSGPPDEDALALAETVLARAPVRAVILPSGVLRGGTDIDSHALARISARLGWRRMPSQHPPPGGRAV